MSKSTVVIIIYVLGLVIGALFFDLWGAETSIKKGLIGIGWTALFLIFLFLAEKKEDQLISNDERISKFLLVITISPELVAEFKISEITT